MNIPTHDGSKMSRRNFLKVIGAGTMAAAATSCGASAEADKAHTIAGTGEMTMRVNHNTGDTVSILGYGMMRLPTKKIVDGVNEREVIDQDMVNELVDVAMANGVNYYDTSPVYCQGHSEEATGIALSRYPRDSYYIATKLSNFSPDQQSYEKSVEMFENSLKYLQTDYIDYLLLHSIGDMGGFQKRFIDNGMLEYLQGEKEKGRIRNLGFSFHGQAEFYDEMMKMMDEGKVHWDFVQIQMNYSDWNCNPEKDPAKFNRDAEYLYVELHKRNIPAVLMEPLLGGRLANMPDPILAKMKQRRSDDTPAAWAFRFAGTPEGVLTVLSGMTYMEHLQDNLRTYSPLDPTTDEENEFLRLITQEYQANRLIDCTACNYCMPCPYGLDIPAIFRHYNKCINEDNVARDTRDPHYAAARKAFLVSLDRAVPPQRQADRCIGCEECVSHCPQNIRIPREMRRIGEYTTNLRQGKA